MAEHAGIAMHGGNGYMYRKMRILELGSMVERYSITEARSRFPELVRKAEEGGVAELTRHGSGVAFLIGRREYERLISGGRSFARTFGEFEGECDLEDLGIDPKEVFGRRAARGRDQGA